MYYSVTRCVLNIDLLFPVTKLNTLNAMRVNISYLGLTMEQMLEDIHSPFNFPQAKEMATHLPSNLQPTTLQLQVFHHPWLDIFPVPSLRDALLRRIGQYDEDEICEDLFNECEGNEGRVGLLVWGEPWDSQAYEISEAVLRKWKWIVSDCPHIVLSSNYWRAKRGDGLLCI